MFVKNIYGKDIYIDTIKIKRLILRIAWSLEILIFSFGYFYGFSNTKDIKRYSLKVKKQNKIIDSKKAKIAELEAEKILWQSEPWLQEKYAREYLQMGDSNEEHYILKDI